MLLVIFFKKKTKKAFFPKSLYFDFSFCFARG